MLSRLRGSAGTNSTDATSVQTPAGHTCRSHEANSPDDPSAQFIREVGSLGDAMVFNKTASGVFASKNLHDVLKNLDIQTIVVCGVFTDECVESATRSGCDLGYQMIVISDARAAVTTDRHQDSRCRVNGRYAMALKTQGFLAWLDADAAS